MTARVEITIRELHSRDEMTDVLRVADDVWGIAPGGLVGPDFLVALAHADGYVVGAYDPSNRMVGMSFGFMGRHEGDAILHSHVTGVVPSLQNAGLGATIKFHQRDWATSRGLRAVTWTFDPLVRRNAWFNLRRLGARAVEYHVNFYGPLGDDINGDDESDRLLARWDVRDSQNSHDTHDKHDTLITVPTPDDIVALRHSDPDAARDWRVRLREQLAPLLRTHDATGVTTDGDYIITPKIITPKIITPKPHPTETP